MDKILIKGLKATCIIGDYDWERKRPQKIILDLEMEADLSRACADDSLSSATLDYNRLAMEVLKYCEKSAFRLIETLAEAIAELSLKKFPIQRIIVRLIKPSAIKAADAAIVEITREA